VDCQFSCLQLNDLTIQARTEKEQIEKIYQVVDAADKLSQESKSIKAQIQELEYKLNISAQGLRTIDEIQSEIVTAGDMRQG
jgi:cell division protein FtsB